tara:strand:- start:2032 stop:2853 length:822 start_codon:yes stop_codon:yes gene_type:complete
MIDMWYPSRIDPQFCPLDWWLVKYVSNISRERLENVNAKMQAGSSAEGCFVDILKGKDKQATINHWIDILDQHKPLHPKDAEQKLVCKKAFPDVVDNLLTIANEHHIQPILTQELVQGKMHQLKRPIGGYVDITEEHYINEIKTAWPSVIEKKDGFGIRKPTNLAQPRVYWVRQVATYAHAAQKKPRILYADPLRSIVFDAESTDYLNKQHLKAARETMRASARARENLLSISDNYKMLARFIAPDFTTFIWNDIDQNTMNEIKEIWGYENEL